MFLKKRPVDIQKIRQRIRKEHYRSIKDLEADVNLMCSNTQQYNIDGSLIYEDSVILKSVFSSAKESMEKDGTLPPGTGLNEITDFLNIYRSLKSHFKLELILI